jgi:hypothetical protein
MAPKAQTFCHRATERSIHLAQRDPGGTIPATANAGGVVEWLMAPVLKTGRAQALVGSNPTPSATYFAGINCRRRVMIGIIAGGSVFRRIIAV